MCQTNGLKPGVLSRGYGGDKKGPHIVDLDKDTAHSVGDEPLVLAKKAMVCVGADRMASAEILIENGCDLLLWMMAFKAGIFILILRYVLSMANGALVMVMFSRRAIARKY